MKKRLLGLLLAVMLIATLCTVSALAADNTIATGYCGSDSTANAQVYAFTDTKGEPQQTTYYDNATWALTANGTASDGKSTYKLTISGAGPMGNFFSSWSYGRPWLDAIAEHNGVELTDTKPYITELEIQDGITVIGERAFAGFTGITEIVLPDTVTDVKDSAFNSCNKVTSIDFSENLVTIEKGGFEYMSALTSIELPENLITIGNSAFESASALTGNLKIPDSVRVIEDAAFANCTSLNGTLTLGNSVEEIGSRAFSGLKFTGTLTIPDSVKSIGESAFQQTAFSGLSLGNGVETIGKNAFYGSGITGDLIIPDSVRSIGDTAFNGVKFSSIRMGSSVSEVGEMAFHAGTTALHTLDITAAPDSAGYGSSAFGSMNVPNTVYVSNSIQVEKVSSALTYPSQRTSFAVTNGGVFPVATKFEAGKLATPVRDGYHFVGWFEQDGTESGSWGTEVGDGATLRAGSTFYAQWIENEATDVPEEMGTVEFDDITYGGSAPGARTVSLEVPVEEDTTVTIKKVSCNNDDFTVNVENGTVTVVPKERLNAGTYTGTVCVYTEVTDSENNTTTPTYWFAVSITVEKQDSHISFAESSVSKLITDEPFTVVLSGVADGAAVTYSSSNSDVAVVYSSGLVTIRGAGTATITATADDTLNYNGSSTSFVVTVTDPSAVIPGDDDGPAIDVPDTYPITVADTANGSVDVSYSNASKGSVITVTVAPDEGFIVGAVSVTGEDGAVEVKRVNSTTYSFVMPESAVTVSVNFVSGSAGFVDVPAGAWYSDAVAYVYANGLMQGTSATTFEPDASLTRSMVWAVLARMDGETVSGTGWQSVARAWAVRSGVSDGTDPNGLITREQLVTMLWRFAGEPTTDATLSGYSDAASVNAWATTAMAWAIDNGIITGVTGTTLVPQGTATRAQCAAILMRYVENV